MGLTCLNVSDVIKSIDVPTFCIKATDICSKFIKPIRMDKIYQTFYDSKIT